MKTFNKIILSIILLYSGIGISFGQTGIPTYTLEATNTGNGNYTLTLVASNTPSSNYVNIINMVNWNFDDGTTLNNHNLTQSHQFLANGSYIVQATVTVSFQNTQDEYWQEVHHSVVRNASMTLQVTSVAQTCPTLVFLPADTDCGQGKVNISLSECENPSNAQFQNILWNMGDGTDITTTDFTVNHTYTANNIQPVHATATYVLSNGSTCQTVALNYVDADENKTLEEICAGATADVLLVPIMIFDGYLSLNPTGPITDNTNYNIVANYNAVSTTLGYSYTIYLDGIELASGSSLPPSGSTLFTTMFTEGQHVLECEIGYPKISCTVSMNLIIDVFPPEPPCDDCFTFKPEPGNSYWVSAWVKEEHVNQVLSYDIAAVQLEFTNSGSPAVTFHTTGEIIEGWQRIVGEFVIPMGTTDLKINLLNGTGSVPAYFDDIRIHPFNASMKSYVYDPITFLLTAELDDNNYATFYEYDKEGQLIRIKKETARGVMTIQESRSSNPKN